jgi:hypothetical protein
MTGTDLCVNKPHKSRSYLNHLVQKEVCIPFIITKEVNLIHFADTFTKFPKTAH